MKDTDRSPATVASEDLASGPTNVERSRADSGRRRSGRVRRRAWAPSLTRAGIAASILLTVSAPLAAGLVHRPTLIAAMAMSALGLAALGLGTWGQRSQLRIGWAVAAPLALLAIPLLQSLPLPLAVRSVIDPNGSALLKMNDLIAVRWWPLSLDPPSTRVQVGVAAAALCVFIVAFHMASGRSRRHLMPRALGAAGVAAVVVATGHRILGVTKLYGLFTTTSRTPLIGPFVNTNHTAEFLELTTFVCLACSFQRPTTLNRSGWLVGTFLCAAGALATLSRGGVVALAAGALTFAFLLYLTREGAPAGRRRRAAAWGLFLLALVGLGAAAFGANQVVERFRPHALTSDLRLAVWRDSLRVLAAHPFGIGRGAFDCVFPIYRELKTSYPVRFAFIENEPLQMLIDSGWLFFALFALAIGFALFQLIRHGRRDRIEAALVAGLVAVVVHSVVDFGLETLGVLLPFTAVLATLMGRLHDPARRSPPFATTTLAAAACVAALLGTVWTGRSSNDNIDALLKHSPDAATTRRLLERGQTLHPLDYFYPLAYARYQPLRTEGGPVSPRLHTLNRALRLCPNCELTHVEVARSLWALGRRQQALLEWRSAISLSAGVLDSALGELFVAGATPEQLASLASVDPSRLVDVAHFLNGRGRPAEAFAVLDQADVLGADRHAILLTRAQLHLGLGQLAPAQVALAALDAANVQDPRLFILKAKAILLAKGPGGADEALASLDLGATRYPFDSEIQRERVRLVIDYKRWHAATRAVDGLKAVLYHQQGSASEAHVAAARIESGMGHVAASLAEYRTALTEDPGNVGLWLEFGRTAQAGGRSVVAHEAFMQASRLSPQNNDILKLVRETDDRAGSPVRSLVGVPHPLDLGR